MRDSTKLSLFFVKFGEFLKCTADRRSEYEALAANAREEELFSGTMCCGPRVSRKDSGRSIREAPSSQQSVRNADALLQDHRAGNKPGRCISNDLDQGTATTTTVGEPPAANVVESGSVTPGWK